MQFAAIEFEEKSCAVVPVTWIENNESCYWPNNLVSQKQFRFMIKTYCPPLPKWNMHTIKRVHFTCDNLEDAEKRLNEIIDHSTHSENDETNESPLYLREVNDEADVNDQSFSINNSKDGEIDNATSSSDDTYVGDVESNTNVPSVKRNKKEYNTGLTNKKKRSFTINTISKDSTLNNANSSSDDTCVADIRSITKVPSVKQNKTERNNGAASKRNISFTIDASKDGEIDNASSSSDDTYVADTQSNTKVPSAVKRNKKEHNSGAANKRNIRIDILSSSERSYQDAQSDFLGDRENRDPLPRHSNSQLSAKIARMSPGVLHNIIDSSPSTSRSEFRSSRISSPITSDQTYKEKVIKCLERIIAVQDQHSIHINEIVKTVNNNNIKTFQRPENFPTLPLEKNEDFEQLEEMLKNHRGSYNFLKNRLVCLGGNGVRGSTTNMIKFVFSDRLGRKFNWAGNNGKIPFKATKLLEVIKEAVYLAFSSTNDRLPDLNDVTIATALKDWLRLAKQRYINKRNNSF